MDCDQPVDQPYQPVDQDGVVEHTHCRACTALLRNLWNLGSMHIVGFPTSAEPLPLKAPLVLAQCTNPDCRLVQLRHTVPAEKLFREYWYRSGTNESMIRALADVVRCARERCPVDAGDVVLDIGANDGTLLKQYRTTVCPIRVAIDPARGVQEELVKHCEVLIPSFFPDPAASPDSGAFKIITAIAMAYDLEDPNTFFAEVKRLLAPNGLFVLQLGYLGDLLKRNAFDSICHEHLEYYSLTSLCHLLGWHELQVEEVAFNDVNGGSLRCYVRHAGHTRSGMEHTVLRAVNQEALDGLHTPERYAWLRERVDRIKACVRYEVSTASAQGRAVDIYGASTKGLTLLQYFWPDISKAHGLRYVVDRNPIKLGRRYGGTGLQITNEETWRLFGVWEGTSRPAFALVLPWHFRKGIVEREKATGVPLLFPLPDPEFELLSNRKLLSQGGWKV